VDKNLSEAEKRLSLALPGVAVFSSLGPAFLQTPIASLRLPTFREVKRSARDEELRFIIAGAESEEEEEEDTCFDLDL
jgi:hypothetical protein